MADKEDYKLLDLLSHANAFNLGWRFSKYEKSNRMVSVIQNIAKYNKGNSFAEGLLQGFSAGRSKNFDKDKRASELDFIFKAHETSKEKDRGEPER